MAFGSVPISIASLAHCDPAGYIRPKRRAWIRGPYLGRRGGVPENAWSLPLRFVCFSVVVLELLLLLLLLLVNVVFVVVVGIWSISGSVCVSTPILAGVVNELPMFLDGTRLPFFGPGGIGVVDGCRGNHVVVYIHEFDDVFPNMYPCGFVQ